MTTSPPTSFTARLGNPLSEASLSAQGALRGELSDRLHKAGLSVDVAERLHARVVRIDETAQQVAHPHHGFALVLMADRELFRQTTEARKVLQELVEDVLAPCNPDGIVKPHGSCHEAVIPLNTLYHASTSSVPDQPDCKTLEETHNCMLFSPTAARFLEETGSQKAVLFARSVPDLLGGINQALSANRHINLALHQSRDVS